MGRVPGDDLDPSVSKFLKNSMSKETEDLENYLSPVQYREKLGKEFNHRGFLKFRNLAKISRPRKRKKGIRGEIEGRRKNEFAIVELLEEEEEEEEEEDRWRELAGDGFKGKEWRGPTRLLLLDERYADKDSDDLPEAIKV